MFRFRDAALTLLGLSNSFLSAQPNGPAANAQDHLRKIQFCVSELVVVKGESQACRTLAQRMAELHPRSQYRGRP